MHNLLSTDRISYAQNREDVLMHALLGAAKKGFYVDVGANHPVKESVTKHFYNHGWRGINIEPSPKLHALLAADRPYDLNLMLGVSNKEGELLFRDYEHGDGLSTFSTEMQDMYEKTHYYYASKYKEYKVPVTTLAAIFEEHKVKTIDFLKVDIEGYEYEALVGNDWKKYRPRLICIEADHIMRDWHSIIEEAGYDKVFFDGLNEYFIRREDAELKKKFSYSKDVLLAPAFVKWEIHNEFLDADREKRLARLELEQVKAELDTNRQNAGGHVPASGGIRMKAKSFLRRVDRGIESRLVPHPARHVQPLASDVTKLKNEDIVSGIQKSLGDALQKEYHGTKQSAGQYYRRARSAVAARRKKS